MELKTKFGLRDTVWFMSENKVHHGEVMEISLTLKATPEGNQQCVIYHIHDYNNSTFTDLSEYSLFPNKEELLKSL